ncbi:MAG: MFS transporter [Bacteroidota bacterium]
MITLFVAYIDRLNITFALPLMADEYGWTNEQVQQYGSQLIGLFYAAYGISNIFLTPLTASWGTRKNLILIICLWSIFTALGAFVSQILMLLLATRILLGLSEGIHVPMMMTATKSWFPPHERGRANSIVAAGIFLAFLLSPLFLVPMMAEFGWRSGFHLLAFIGLLLSLPLVYFFVYDKPELSPSIQDSELAYIREGLAEEQKQQDSGLNWRQAIRIPGFLFFIGIGVGNNLIGVGLSSWIPTYFTEVRGIPFEEVSWLVAAPYAFSILGLLIWSVLGDHYSIRAMIAGICGILAGLALLLALQVDSLLAVVIFFSLGTFFLCSFQAAEFALLQRILPQDKFASFSGMYNGMAILLGGGLGPALMAPIIGDGEGTWSITVVAVIYGLMLLGLYRKLKY